ncbi:hypothetical protein ACIBG8_19610 [Nonomuraea sp. NPDC050556]|uniref:hypothetical protein n=1 Tax=Nonomuraea sp. NPDC050556 TaxID=3364369 RepID=UPI0037B24942
MAVLKFDDLKADVDRELRAKGLEFIAKNGDTVLLRPVMLLGKEELKVVRTLLEVIQDDKSDAFTRLEAMDSMMIAASDGKKAFKDSLAELPPQIRSKIFDAWMKGGELGEASA